MITLSTRGRFEIVTVQHPDWDEYVRQHPKGSIFHTSALIRAFGTTRELEPYARAALDGEGRIVALLSSCHVKTLRHLSALTSRAVQFAEPLCDPDETGLAALAELVADHDRYMRSRALLCEIRPLHLPSCDKPLLVNSGYEHRDYINYIVDTTRHRDVLWENIDRRMRVNIRGTINRGVVLRDDASLDGVGRLYRMLQESFSRARVPLYSQRLFEQVLTALPPECVRLRTAFLGDQPVASMFNLVYGDRVYSWYGGTLRVPGLSPYGYIVWDDIAWSSDNGYALYDFGGAGWPGEDYGPRDFKAKFNGDEVRYGRYMLTYSEWRLRVAKMAYQATRKLGTWSRPRR